jgi:hypothetical protein
MRCFPTTQVLPKSTEQIIGQSQFRIDDEPPRARWDAPASTRRAAAHAGALLTELKGNRMKAQKKGARDVVVGVTAAMSLLLLTSCSGGAAATPADIKATLATTDEWDDHTVDLPDGTFNVTLTPNENLSLRVEPTSENQVEILSDQPGGKGNRHLMTVRGPGTFSFTVGAEWDDGDYNVRFDEVPAS